MAQDYFFVLYDATVRMHIQELNLPYIFEYRSHSHISNTYKISPVVRNWGRDLNFQGHRGQKG